MQPSTPPAADRRAAFLSALLPGLGQVVQGRLSWGLVCFSATVTLMGLSAVLGRVSGRAAEVFFFMLLALPWWAFQSYDASLGSPLSGTGLQRTWSRAWQQAHDLRFLGVLFLVSAVNDTIIIANNPDYLLPFFCTKLQGFPGFLTKAISPLLHTLVGYGFLYLFRWSLLIYLVYAAYGITNAMVNLTCFGPGRVRNTLLLSLIVFTAYILWRRHVFRR